jgi:hypothetical protein
MLKKIIVLLFVGAACVSVALLMLSRRAKPPRTIEADESDDRAVAPQSVRSPRAIQYAEVPRFNNPTPFAPEMRGNEKEDQAAYRRQELEEKMRPFLQEERRVLWASKAEASVKLAFARIGEGGGVKMEHIECRNKHCAGRLSWTSENSLSPMDTIFKLDALPCAKHVNIETPLGELPAFGKIIIDCSLEIGRDQNFSL